MSTYSKFNSIYSSIFVHDFGVDMFNREQPFTQWQPLVACRQGATGRLAVHSVCAAMLKLSQSWHA